MENRRIHNYFMPFDTAHILHRNMTCDFSFPGFLAVRASVLGAPAAVEGLDDGQEAFLKGHPPGFAARAQRASSADGPRVSPGGLALGGGAQPSSVVAAGSMSRGLAPVREADDPSG
jgi:hypothetical protein